MWVNIKLELCTVCMYVYVNGRHSARFKQGTLRYKSKSRCARDQQPTPGNERIEELEDGVAFGDSG
jgi:hypothetical protein